MAEVKSTNGFCISSSVGYDNALFLQLTLNVTLHSVPGLYLSSVSKN